VAQWTKLVIIPISPNTAFQLTEFSGRDITQTLDPIVGARAGRGDAYGSLIRMDGNGNLINLARPQFDLYQSVVSFEDVDPIALDGGWIGQAVEVWCSKQLSYPVGGTAQRLAVSGSSYENNGFIFYNPILAMLVTGYISADKERDPHSSTQLFLRETNSGG